MSEQGFTGTAGTVKCGHVWREVVNARGLWLWSCMVCGACRNADGRISGAKA
jgi:hypothetical protein